MQEQNVTFASDKIDYPWLLFKLNKNVFAISSRRVIGIQTLPEGIEKMPDSPDCIRGIYSLRGVIVPLLDIRKELGMPTLDDEYNQFVGMLSQRQQDHIHWVEELRLLVDENKPFKLATDPHKCAFGKWRDSFKSEVDSINHLIKKVDEPHGKLHASAIEVITCDRQHDKCKRQICAIEAYNKAEQQYMPAVLAILDEMKEAFRDTYKEMAIYLDFGGKQVGIIVDEVMSVEQLEEGAVSDDSMKKFCEQRFVSGIGKSTSTDGIVLMVDEEQLCGTYCAVN